MSRFTFLFGPNLSLAISFATLTTLSMRVRVVMQNLTP